MFSKRYVVLNMATFEMLQRALFPISLLPATELKAVHVRAFSSS